MSTSPEASVSVQKSKKKAKGNTKSTGNSKEKAPVQPSASQGGEEQGRNEGVDPNWAYQPPAGMVVFDTSDIDEEFDWDSVKNDDNKELWIMRVPEGFKTRQLDDMGIQLPSDPRGAKLSTIERKRAKYDVWSLPQSNLDEIAHGTAEQLLGGEEIQNISCLLPRKKKRGNFYVAPKPISQHIIITHAPATPHVDVEATPTPSTRHSVPKHLLKHRFLPYGAASLDTSIQRAAHTMDVDVEEDDLGNNEGIGGKKTASTLSLSVKKTRTPKTTPRSLQKLAEKKSGKKRKQEVSETETPGQGSKKLKT